MNYYMLLHQSLPFPVSTCVVSGPPCNFSRTSFVRPRRVSCLQQTMPGFMGWSWDRQQIMRWSWDGVSPRFSRIGCLENRVETWRLEICHWGYPWKPRMILPRMGHGFVKRVVVSWRCIIYNDLMTLPVWRLYQSVITCCAAIASWRLTSHFVKTHVHSSLVCQGLTTGGRAAGDEFQRTVGAFFAIYWLFRSLDHTWWRWRGNEMSRNLILVPLLDAAKASRRALHLRQHGIGDHWRIGDHGSVWAFR